MTTLPSDLTYGKVVGRFVMGLGDGADVGREPDGYPATGSITITAPNIFRMTDIAEPATILPMPIQCGIDDDGYLIDLEGQRGVWLITGNYRVEYSLDGSSIKTHDIVVTEEHTDASPLDLTKAILVGTITVTDFNRLTEIVEAAKSDTAAAQAAAQSSATDAQQAADNATLALQAQFLTQDEGVAALIESAAGPQTQAALRTHVIPSRQVKVEAMPSWTGNPADDQTAAFNEAAASFTGAAQVLIPAGTWIVQGAPIREGLYWVGEGSGPNGTVLTLPASPAANLPMFKWSGSGAIWSGGHANLKMVGNGGNRGAGVTAGVHGIDLFGFSQTHGYWVTDCHIERFDHGIRGAQSNNSTAVGDDRWLIIEGCLVWDNLIGIYANEHPQLAGNDVRRNDIGLTGRLYDLNLTDRNKFIRNRVGISGDDPIFARSAAGASTIISSAIFFRNDTAMILNNDCHVIGNFIEGGTHDPVAGTDSLGYATGIVVKGARVSIVGNYFNPAASVECQTDILVDLPASTRADLAITANTFRHAQSSRTVLRSNGTHPLLGVKFSSNTLTLKGNSHGLLLGDPSNGAAGGGVDDVDISNNTVYLEQGYFFRAYTTDDSTIADNHITVGGATSRTVRVIWGGNSTKGSAWAGNRLNVKGGVTSTADFLRVSGVGVKLTDNVTVAGYPISLSSATSGSYRIAGNVGFKTEARGTVSMPAGTATVTITHGMVDSGTTGYYALVSPINGQANVWVSGRTAAGFTINRSDTTAAIVVAWYGAVYTEVA